MRRAGRGGPSSGLISMPNLVARTTVVPVSLEGGTEQPFTVAARAAVAEAAVRVGGVEQGDARVECGVDDRLGPFLVEA